jgi:hydroxyisourate hydrolase
MVAEDSPGTSLQEALMSGVRPTISTHVLDTEAGEPAPGIHVRLTRLVDDGAEVEAGSASTDADGRVRQLLEGELTTGRYRLRFDLRGHRGGFFQLVALDLHVSDPSRSYHVPLLLSPFAITTYRGS